ncbi:uncharacterized protein [Miscanthus floridulus]|uniref:uncharacterized protein isoform X2 n=1 Tax=Miscanthus floridulus TaxID=154761 RepID=UPI00345B15CB
MTPSAAAGPSLARPSRSHLWRDGGALQPVSAPHVLLQGRRRCRHRRLTGVVRAAPDAPPVVRAAVSAVTELLRALSPNKNIRDGATQQGDDPVPPSCGSVDDVLAVLQEDYRRAYFLTGDFTPGIYTEDCLFEDPTIKFRGLSRYSQNLDLLVPFFDSPSLELESIEKGLRVETKFVKATWKLRTYLRLPWRPLIAIRGNTTYDLNEDFKVTRHSESWDVSALEAIAQIFISAPEPLEGS